MSDRIHMIETCLRNALIVQELRIRDESAAHAGHPGTREHGGGHFAIHLVSPEFSGKTMVQRHQMIYQALHSLMPREIHACRIEALTPEELQAG